MVPDWAALESLTVTMRAVTVSAGLPLSVPPLRVKPFRSSVNAFAIVTFSFVSAINWTVAFFTAASIAA